MTDHYASQQSYERRRSESVGWGISVHDRYELEGVSRASLKSLDQYQEQDFAELDFRSKVAGVLAKAGLEKKADRYLLCSSQAFILRCEGPERHEFFSPDYCDLRFCEICAMRQFCRLRAKHSPVLDFINQNPRPGFRLRSITLTSTNEHGLTHKQIITFNPQVKKTLLRLMKGVKGWGAIAVLEVGFNNWNLHAHILAWCPFIEQKELAAVWHQISGHQVVWISEAEGSGQAALGYLLKYVSKPPSKIPENIGQLEIAFHGTRRVHCYGLFYNFSGEDVDGEKSKWTGCPKCGAPLERIQGTFDVHEMPRKGLEFIGNVRRQKEKTKWVN
jgi:hypothetical protein